MNSTFDHKIKLQQAHLQITPARVAAMQLFESHDQPIDAQHIIDHLQKEIGIDRVTVFRILNAFVAKGLIRKLEFGEGKARYELNNDDHHHLICEACGKIDDLPHYDIPQREKDLKKMKGFLITSHSVEYFGICKNCQKKGITKIRI